MLTVNIIILFPAIRKKKSKLILTLLIEVVPEIHVLLLEFLKTFKIGPELNKKLLD